MTGDWQPTRLPFKDEDAWNMFSVLAEAIADGVEFYAERSPGYPGHLDSAQEYQERLRAIVEGFRAVRELDDGPFMSDEATAKFDRAWELLRDEFLGMWT